MSSTEGTRAFHRALLGGVAAAAMMATMAASQANAAIVMNFVGLQNEEEILNYYNGGKGSKGSGPGPNFGVSYGADALALISTHSGGTGNFCCAPSNTIAFFLSGPGDVMTKTSGFKTGFSFYYSSDSHEVSGVNGKVDVYSGPSGTGSLLASLSLADTGNTGPSGSHYNMWDAIGVSFAGTAESVIFTGAANYIGFDNITLGSAVPGGVPEPSSLALLGSGLFAFGWFRRRRKK